MIKVEVYFSKGDFDEGIPTAIISLKEFENMFNGGDYPVSNAYSIRFIVA